MKKVYYIYIIIILTMIFADCATHKKTEYVFPDYIQEDRRPALVEIFEKGRILYESYCSSCHGIYSKGKDNAPNFTDFQIDTYTAWTIKKDPRSHAMAANMSADQLQEIFMFLKFRKRKGNPDAKSLPDNQAKKDSVK